VVNLGEDSFNRMCTESDSGRKVSLQPYEMTVHDSDLERHELPLQLSELHITSLRKGDRPMQYVGLITLLSCQGE
jgi:hypothetical protein